MLHKIYSSIRRLEQERNYHRRREYYAAKILATQSPRSDAEIVAAVNARLLARGWSAHTKVVGDCHTFAFIPQTAWHSHLLPDLRELGQLTLYDYIAAGYTSSELWRGTDASLRRRREMNGQLVAAALSAHHKQPLDWMFFYGTGHELIRDTLRELREKVGAPMVLMCLDDKQSWDLHSVSGQNAGQKDIVAEFDLCWTSAHVCKEWYLAEGALAIYLPEGFNATAYRPMPVQQDIALSFVGSRYGFRGDMVSFLRSHNLEVTAFGPGWENAGVWGEEQVRVFNRSRINLGHGGILHSAALTNVKTRDFEVPGTGGGAYVTSFNRDLAEHFQIGREIFCFRDRWELVELLRELLRNPVRLQQAATEARECCLRKHRWLHRYQAILRMLNLL
jgi:hypothetical protein